MDFAANALAERAIHQLMAREGSQALERDSYQESSKVRVVVRAHFDLRIGDRLADEVRDLSWIHGVIMPGLMSALEDSALSAAQLLESARRTFDIEAAGLTALRARVDESFVAACRVCLRTHGRIVTTGLGKAGHVAHKIASTLASTGSPAFFLHPTEAGHGDLGMIMRGDVLLAVSNSGETREVLALLPPAKRLALPLIAMTGKPASTLARAADVHLDTAVAQEACPHNLAPTASTTAQLAMGDALAVALLEARGFSVDDFARAHPDGSLGRRLLLHVEEVMRQGAALPKVLPETLLAQGLLEMSRKGLGMTAIVDEQDRVLGIFTDGDLRRTLDRRVDVHTVTMREVMTPGGKSVSPRELAASAVQLLEANRITSLLVVDTERHLIGALHVHDLMRAGVL
jgi:arabinose-5-phosphate isomerase